MASIPAVHLTEGAVPYVISASSADSSLALSWWRVWTPDWEHTLASSISVDRRNSRALSKRRPPVGRTTVSEENAGGTDIAKGEFVKKDVCHVLCRTKDVLSMSFQESTHLKRHT